MKVFYLTIREGTGKKLTGLSGNVKMNYLINRINHDFPEAAEKQQVCDLSQMIPGIAQGMISMKEGEIRKISIHPHFAYGYSNTFEPNIALEATVELISILSDQNETPVLKEILPASPLEITQDDIDALLLKSYYAAGWQLWNHLKFGYKLFSKEEVIDCLKKDSDMPLSQSEFYKEINRIHWLIYRQQIEDEYKESTSCLDQLSSQIDIKPIVPGFLYCRSSSNLNKDLKNSNLFTIKATIKDRHGEILQTERSEIIDSNSSIRGLKEGLPYLTLGEPATLYIHPQWGFPDNNGPLGDKLLVIDLVIIERISGLSAL